MGLCICRDWLLKERSSFTPVRDADERASPKADRFCSFRSSLSPTTTAASTICTTSQPITSQPPIERINSNNHNTAVDEDRNGGQEISYNKISVREPLSKILAERAILEHHYNEVDGEGESCFYEEIAGATNTSATSTIDDGKLGRQSSDEADVITDPGYEVVNFHQQKSEPCYAVIDKSLNNSGDDEVESASVSVQRKSIERRQSDDEDYSTADPGYEVVNFHQQTSEPCYAVIDKSVNSSGDGEVGSTIVSVPGKPINSRLCDDEDYSTADPGYEVVSFHQQKSEPCYAVIDKNVNNSGNSEIRQKIISKPLERRQLDDEDDFIADPGYEVINAQKSEPCYAVIDKSVNKSGDGKIRSAIISVPGKPLERRQLDDEDLTADPGYEVINAQKSEPCYAVIDKNVNSGDSEIRPTIISKPLERRQSDDEDYLIADPGYEVINAKRSEPCYAVIDKNINSSCSTQPSVPFKSSSIAQSIHNEKLSRQSTDEDDSSYADPGYEVINTRQKKSDPS